MDALAIPKAYAKAAMPVQVLLWPTSAVKFQTARISIAEVVCFAQKDWWLVQRDVVNPQLLFVCCAKLMSIWELIHDAAREMCIVYSTKQDSASAAAKDFTSTLIQIASPSLQAVSTTKDSALPASLPSSSSMEPAPSKDAFNTPKTDVSLAIQDSLYLEISVVYPTANKSHQTSDVYNVYPDTPSIKTESV